MQQDLLEMFYTVQCILNVHCITQVAFLKYFKFWQNGHIPDVETYTKKPQTCTSRHTLFSIALAHVKNFKIQENWSNEGFIQTPVVTANFSCTKHEPCKAI